MKQVVRLARPISDGACEPAERTEPPAYLAFFDLINHSQFNGQRKTR
jgi:hypothetical protein